jgi:hypothetical protein
MSFCWKAGRVGNFQEKFAKKHSNIAQNSALNIKENMIKYKKR